MSQTKPSTLKSDLRQQSTFVYFVYISTPCLYISNLGMNQSDLTMDVLNQDSQLIITLQYTKNIIQSDMFLKTMWGPFFVTYLGCPKLMTLILFFSWTFLKYYHILSANYFVLKLVFKPFAYIMKLAS